MKNLRLILRKAAGLSRRMRVRTGTMPLEMPFGTAALQAPQGEPFGGPWKLVFSIALAVVLTGSPAQAADQLALVFGPDDRRPLKSSEKKLARVTGTLWRKANVEVASATILDHPSLPANRTWDVVLTSAHAFVDRRGQFAPTGYWFSRGADPQNKVRVSSVYFPKRFDFQKVSPRNDWALAVVGRRLTAPGEGVAPLVLSERSILKRARSGGRLMLVAHNVRTRTIQVSDNCGIIPKRLGDQDFGPRVFNMDCDMEVSASGGALMLKWAGRHYAAGVAAGDTHRRSHKFGAPFNPRRHVNLAVGLPPELHAALDQLGKTGKFPTSLP